MIRRFALSAFCIVFGFHLAADTLPTLDITSLTFSATGGGPNFQVTASGPFITFQVSGGRASPPGIADIGLPVGFVSQIAGPGGGNFTAGGFIAKDANIQECQGSISALDCIPVGIDAVFAPTFLIGITVSGTTDQLVPASGTVTFAGTATGGFGAFSCPDPFEDPRFCHGPQIANVEVDLPGLISVSYAPVSPGDISTGVTHFQGLSFVTTPEPGAARLLLFGASFAIFVWQMARYNAIK